MKRNIRLLIVSVVILTAFILVGFSLAAANHASQALLPLPPTLALPPTNLGGQTSQFANLSNSNLTGAQTPPADLLGSSAQANYQPFIQRPPGHDWQSQPDFASQAVLGDLDAWDGSGVYVPTILKEGSSYVMWFTGIAWDGSYGLGQATSSNGTDWTKAGGNPQLSGASEAAILKVAVNDYRLYYSNWDEGTIYVATSTDGSSWTPGGSPILEPGSGPDDWDRNFVSDPVVLEVGGTYYMFYEGGLNDGEQIQIGLATSSDGLTGWTRVSTDPVLNPGDPSDWDEHAVLDPMVIENGGNWQMWFGGSTNDWAHAIGYATSGDGQNWTKYGSNPVLEADNSSWDTGGPGGHWVINDGGTYKMWYSSNRQIGYATSTDGIDWDRPLGGSVLQPSPLLYIELNYAQDWVHLYTQPNTAVTVTLEDAGANFKGSITGFANDWGDFWSQDWPWDPEWQDIAPNDSIYIEAAGLSDEVAPIGEIDAKMDIDIDEVNGTLNTPWFAEVEMGCELWAEPYLYIDLGMIAGDGGTFTCDFYSEGVDLQPGMQVAVVYFEPDGDRVLNVLENPWMRVNIAHDWAGGNYPAGHTFEITVKDSGGAVKATTTVESQPGWGWGGDGFDTNWESWVPAGPDIQPGDWVYFEADDGFTDTIHVGDIQGTLDIDLNKVSGPIYVNWYEEDLAVECHPWGAPPGVEGLSSTAGPDGDPPYTCDWDGLWDIQPGQDVAVMYIQPDNFDRVITVFRETAPDLGIWKGSEGSGQVRPGGPVIFTIWYGNNGDGEATTIWITDTLPENTSYVTDTSGATPTFGGDWVAWELGPLAPGVWQKFQLLLTNSADPDTWLTNAIEINTPFESDPGNNSSMAEIYVQEGDTNLYASKWAPVGDPAPGETYLYHINYGNQDGFTSGPITLTEKLPEGTTLVGWESWNNFTLLEQVSYMDNVLVLTAPALEGYWGDTIRLTLAVDPGLDYNTQLTNTVEITTVGDIDPWNNIHVHPDVWVSPPRLDGRIWKQQPWGTIYPGGEIVYPVSFSNDGNQTFTARITDTLPAGLSFADVHAWRYGVDVDIDLVYVDDQIVVLEYADLPPGEYIDFDLRLAIDPDFTPGNQIVNCIDLDSGGPDGSPFNNHSCNTYQVQDLGTNLRLSNWYWWNWEGQLHYTLDAQNIGSTTFENIWLTDTFPISTTWTGGWGSNGPWITLTENLPANQLIFWIERLNPSDTAHIEFEVDLDGGIIGEKGLTFTNQAEAPIVGDVNPVDNTVETTAYTGADVFAHKWLSGGTPGPGEIITYTIEFGNYNTGPWQGDSNYPSHITDTLPAGSTFITATAPWNANMYWTPDNVVDEVVSWSWGPMWSDSLWRFDIVVELPADLENGDWITNKIEAYGDNPDDFDFDWLNNFELYTLQVDLYPFKLYMPLLLK